MAGRGLFEVPGMTLEAPRSTLEWGEMRVWSETSGGRTWKTIPYDPDELPEGDSYMFRVRLPAASDGHEHTIAVKKVCPGGQ